MAVEQSTVISIARLAHLDITESETKKYTEDLTNIFHIVKSMENVDTSKVEPIIHPLSQCQSLREDAVTETNQRELFQSTAPATAAGLYLVPQVIE